MRERWVCLRDFTFCLCEWGRPTDPLVLILHGWLDQGAAWNRVAQQLAADGFYVVAPDQRGHGQSDHTPPGTGYHRRNARRSPCALPSELRERSTFKFYSLYSTAAASFFKLDPLLQIRQAAARKMGVVTPNSTLSRWASPSFLQYRPSVRFEVLAGERGCPWWES